MHPFTLWIALALGVSAFAGTTPEVTADALQAMNAQQLFNAASDAAADKRCTEALPIFEALLQRAAVAGNPRVLATAHLRRAPCLISVGRFDEAASDIKSAFAAVPADDAILRVDIAEAHLALGAVAYLSFEYDHATREFEAALAMLRPAEQYDALRWLAQSTMFEPGRRSIDYSDKLLALVGEMPEKSKSLMPDVHTLHARALLNHGQIAAAYSELNNALSKQGGLTLKVNISDVETRSDLALAALLAGDRDKAREYMAYTGAGRFEKAPFASAQDMNPPPCGGVADLKPDDMAVIEFSINDEGNVINVMPVYASRNGPVAAEFARAVAGWSWKPQDVAKIPAFFRRVTRVELRCLTTTEHPNVLEVLHGDLSVFLGAHHINEFQGDVRRAAPLAMATSESNRAVAEGHELVAVPIMIALSSSPLLESDEQLRWLSRARDALAAAGAPLGALTYLDVKRFYGQTGGYRQQRAYLRSLLAQPAVAADAHVADTLRLLIAEAHYGVPPVADASDLLTSVATDPALTDQDPLRVGALVRLATLQAERGNLAAARATYQKTGLNAQQCSLVDAVPVVRRYGLSSMDFPQEAIRWGFEGWVLLEFDIRPDGETANQRAVVAYPPLIFPDAAIAGIKDARFTQTYRPEGGLGCGGKRLKVSFRSSR